MATAHMNRIATHGTAALILASLAACTNPYDPAQRGAGGALLGAAGGAAIGGAVGGGRGAGIGAAIGGVTGALGGLATTPQNYGYAPPTYSSQAYAPQYYAPQPYGYGGGYGPAYGYGDRYPTCLTPSCGSYEGSYRYRYPGGGW